MQPLYYVHCAHCDNKLKGPMKTFTLAIGRAAVLDGTACPACSRTLDAKTLQIAEHTSKLAVTSTGNTASYPTESP